MTQLRVCSWLFSVASHSVCSVEGSLFSGFCSVSSTFFLGKSPCLSVLSCCVEESSSPPLWKSLFWLSLFWPWTAPFPAAQLQPPKGTRHQSVTKHSSCVDIHSSVVCIACGLITSWGHCSAAIYLLTPAEVIRAPYQICLCPHTYLMDWTQALNWAISLFVRTPNCKPEEPSSYCSSLKCIQILFGFWSFFATHSQEWV